MPFCRPVPSLVHNEPPLQFRFYSVSHGRLFPPTADWFNVNPRRPNLLRALVLGLGMVGFGMSYTPTYAQSTAIPPLIHGHGHPLPLTIAVPSRLPTVYHVPS